MNRCAAARAGSGRTSSGIFVIGTGKPVVACGLQEACAGMLAIRARRLALAGRVTKAIEPALPCFDENIATIERRLAAPRLRDAAVQRCGHTDMALHGVDLDALAGCSGPDRSAFRANESHANILGFLGAEKFFDA